MRGLEKAGKLDRAIEGLPDDETIAERHTQGIGLTRPEIAVLLAYAKMVLYEDLLKSDLPDDPQLVDDLVLYFPDDLRGRFRAGDRAPSPAPRDHRHRRHERDDQPRAADVRLADVRRDGEAATPTSPARSSSCATRSTCARSGRRSRRSTTNCPRRVQIDMMIAVARLLERAILWLLRSSYEKLDIAAYVNEFRPRIAAIQDHLAQILPASMLGDRARAPGGADGRRDPRGAGAARGQPRRHELGDGHHPHLPHRRRATASRKSRASTSASARASASTACAAATSSIAAETPWQKTALADARRRPVQLPERARLARHHRDERRRRDPVEPWLAKRPRVVERVDQTMHDFRARTTVDLAMLAVASRQFRVLVES